MYSPHTEAERTEMLQAIGVSSFDELLAQVPAALQRGPDNWPPALTEPELMAHARTLAAKNKPLVCFAGAGAQDHFIPAAVSSLLQRGEYLSAYTPYQAEASQGLLQAIYEFQSSICALTGMDAANASHYDGATALAAAAAAAARITGRKKILLPASLHPEWRTVLATYFKAKGEPWLEIVPCPRGGLELAEVQQRLDGTVAAVVVASPNFYGGLEDGPALAQLAHDSGALLISVFDPISLGLLEAPGVWGADMAVGEGQGLGNPLNGGGPYLGLFACKKAYLRHLPGRICGATTDAEGHRGFVLTLQAREQHIRRERAASNICSNEALCALVATIYLALMGPAGLRDVAELCVDKAHRLAEQLTQIPGYRLRFDRPFFNEFVLECPGSATRVRNALLKDGLLAGVPLGAFNSTMGNCLLVCVTESRSDEDLARFVAGIRKISP
ncbi:MAG: aminomethyl-transferring glycine dehydrogenase subunit GcvPA [Kiritimatiellae bacterium]|nr:aminomethyl-transferring glycine dehydrogenase subunit GcvPA [Kiritimatiellia bacterium]MDD4341992.1 aminomethyl-transferring glycine dehydrogenase subunit GcvPA [Kiritimatiellia bacterium]